MNCSSDTGIPANEAAATSVVCLVWEEVLVATGRAPPGALRCGAVAAATAAMPTVGARHTGRTAHPLSRVVRLGIGSNASAGGGLGRVLDGGFGGDLGGFGGGLVGDIGGDVGAAAPPVHCETHGRCAGSSSSLAPSDCYGWKALHARTSGQSWSRCAGRFDEPCGCAGVVCSDVGGEQRITSLRLADYGLVGTPSANFRPIHMAGGPQLPPHSHGRWASCRESSPTWRSCASSTSRARATCSTAGCRGSTSPRSARATSGTATSRARCRRVPRRATRRRRPGRRATRRGRGSRPRAPPRRGGCAETARWRP